MLKRTEWFLIANAARARVVASEDGAPLRTVAVFEHPASRERTSDLASDRAGFASNRLHVGGVALEPQTDPHQKEHRRFAHELGEFLEQKAQAGAFDDLSIFAPNPFMGELKHEMGPASTRLLQAAFHVDLSYVRPEELDVRIRHALAAHIRHELGGRAST